MNIYFREIKAHRYSLLGWCLGLFFLIAAGMAKYGAIETTGQSVNELMDQFPKAFLTIFGIGGFDLSTASGYFGVLYVYIAFMVAIHAALISSEIISKEEKERTSEFLFAKPVSRYQAVSSKLLASLTNIIILNIVTSFSSLYIVNLYAKEESTSHIILLLMVGLLFIQLLFWAIGAAMAGISYKPKNASGIATAFLLFTYIISVFININQKLDWLKYLSPFKYFDAKNIMTDNSLDPFFITLSILLITTSIILTYFFYQKRDLNV